MSQNEEPTKVEEKLMSTGIRVGTSVKTKFMKPFITKASPEGTYMLDLDITLERIKTAAKFINRTGIEKLIVCSGKQQAVTPIEKFCELLGAKKLLGRFMPGTLTNPSLPYYIEPKLVFISDPQLDEQSITEATNAGIPVIGLSNTDNITSKLDLIIPANNRGRKAIATVYWLLARQILIEQGKLKEDEPMKYEIDDFETKVTDEEAE
ncbi:MAG: 30S ribosomal protein S2 [Thaumarchaeota archaeon]|nr:30S ribosomal protein S2 [Nitrososphaerota archaeon]